MGRRARRATAVCAVLLVGVCTMPDEADAAGTIALVSHAHGNTTAGGNDASSSTPVVSAGGRFVVFASQATNLVDGFVDNNGESGSDLFLYDRETRDVTLVSHDAEDSASGGNGNSSQPSISTTGRFIAFRSSAANLVEPFADGNGGFDDAYLFDRLTGEIELLSHQAGDTHTGGNGFTVGAEVSGDGNFITFHSVATDLVHGFVDGNGALADVYLVDRVSGKTSLVSRQFGTTKTGGNSASLSPRLDDQGTFIAFASPATDLIDEFTNVNGTNSDVYLFNRLTGLMRLVSRSAADPTTSSNGSVQQIDVSGNGNFVAFLSTATNLISGFVDGNALGDLDIFLFGRESGNIRLVSHAVGDSKRSGDGSSGGVNLSDDGNFVAYHSGASDLIGGFQDVNEDFTDIFLYSRKTGANRLASRSAADSKRGGNDGYGEIAISGDGSAVGFPTASKNLIAGFVDNNGPEQDLFVFDRPTGTVKLVSHRFGDSTATGNVGSGARPAFDTTGDVIGFRSAALNLIEGFDNRNETDYDVYVSS